MPYKTKAERREAWKKWFAALSPEKQHEYRESERERQRARYEKDRLDPGYKARKRVYNRDVARFAKYQMSQPDFDAMFQRCNGQCQGCGRAMSHNHNAADSCCIDHNHDTGEVRGLLCLSCNMILGYARDSVERLQGLIRYLS